jgi:hypothetical protein
LDAAVVEMIGLLDGTRKPDASIQRRFLDIGQDYEARIKADPKIVEVTADFFAYAHPFGQLSESFAATNPEFLDG